jgi:hypothetical protein
MLLVPRIVIMQPTLVHPQLHVRLALGILVYNKHLIVTIIRDTILLSQISQRDDVGYGFRAEPKVLVVARYSGFPSHYHTTTVTLESHALGGFLGLGNQCLVTEKIHSGLAVQKYDLLKVDLHCRLCLLE